MKNNFPIKYAVMPIMEQTGWSHGLHELVRDYNEVAYIAAKCYLITERKKYSINGKTNISYEVVFPFEKKDYDWKKIEPEYNVRGNCCNSIMVDKVFNSFEEALIEAQNKNDELVSDSVRYCDLSKAESKISERKIRMEYYKSLEQLIEQNTGDLNVCEEPKEQTTVIVGEKNKKIDESLYNVINLWDTSFFKVYSLTPEEYEQITEDLANGLPLEKYNKRLLMVNNPQTKKLEIIDYKNKDTNYNFYDGSLRKSDNEKSYISDINTEKFNTPLISFYTLETYDDAVKSFVSKYLGNKLELGNKVMALRLKM